MSSKTEGVITALIFIVLAFLGGWLLGRSMGIASTQREAIQAGAAEWVAGDDGEVNFYLERGEQ